MLWCHHMSCSGSRHRQTMFRAIRSCKISRRAEEELTSGHLHLEVVIGGGSSHQIPYTLVCWDSGVVLTVLFKKTQNKPQISKTHKKGWSMQTVILRGFCKEIGLCCNSGFSHWAHFGYKANYHMDFEMTPSQFMCGYQRSPHSVLERIKSSSWKRLFIILQLHMSRAEAWPDVKCLW